MEKTAQIRVRIEKQELAAVRRKAARQGISLSELVRRLLRAWERGAIATPEDGNDAAE